MHSRIVVVDEEGSGIPSDVVEQLREVVHLFSSSIEALNHSTVLLKDELQNALSAALERLEPDSNITTDAILEDFNRCTLNSSDARREYIRRLCTRLVTLEDEMRALQSENSQLKANWHLGEDQKELTDLKHTVDEISSLVRKLEERSSRNKPLYASVSSKCSEEKVTINKLQAQLNGIRERLSGLQIAQPESADQSKQTVANESTSQTENAGQKVAKSLEEDNSVEDNNIRQTHESNDDILEKNKKMSRAGTDAQHAAFQKEVQRLLERAETLTTSSGFSLQTEDNSGTHEAEDRNSMNGDGIKETPDDKPKRNQPENNDFTAFGFYAPFYGPPFCGPPNSNYYPNFSNRFPFYPAFRVPPPGLTTPNMFVNNEVRKPRKQMVHRALPCSFRVSLVCVIYIL
ncbi:hypothetical protein P879_07755 [Paragonimus westermani]|uniref:Uncharacterized protein n=1 Tax=Paragonimus westermani TaxID=34504 RepID=A0A8T0DCX7_9TREM|nr:hypothetical protein P879_07755 [Paragonimus westermani]